MVKHSQLATLFLFLLFACTPVPAPTPVGGSATAVVTATPTPTSVVPTSMPTNTAALPRVPTATHTVVPTVTRTPTPYPTPNLSARSEVAFYQLRIVLMTTSDWTALDFESLSARQIVLEGNVQTARLSSRNAHIDQSLDAARSGQAITISFDTAVPADIIAHPPLLRITRGAINATTVSIFLIDESTRLIQQVTSAGVVSEDHKNNPLSFTLNATAVAASTPRRANVLTPAKMVWAIYYPWYYRDSWTAQRLQDIPQHLYSSDDATAISRHMEQARSAGIDGFVVSWWGPSHYTDANFKTVLDVAGSKGFQVAMYFETVDYSQSPPKARPADAIYDWLAYAIRTYGGHSAFTKISGKPIIYLWESWMVPLQTWRDIFARLREQGYDAFFLARSETPDDLAVFDGLHVYGFRPREAWERAYYDLAQTVRYYNLVAEVNRPKLWVPSVGPGETILDSAGNVVRFQERGDGSFYRDQLATATARSNFSWLLITSWNEYFENTHIEPSRRDGDAYLKITREFADKWKGK